MTKLKMTKGPTTKQYREN